MRTAITVAFLLAAIPRLSADATGKDLYEKTCKKCHGADGTPSAALAKMMKVEMKHLCSKEVQAKSDAELQKEAIEGVGKMKPQAGISAADAKAIVAHLRTLKR